MLSVWKNPLEPEIASKWKYAKYHTIRIAKALKAGEDPNLSNPVQQAPPPLSSPGVLDPSDPDVQRVNGGSPAPQARNPYQPYVETAPNTNTQPSPTFSASRVSPPPNLPSAPTGYGQNTSSSTFPPHQDVSPISQPERSRHGSVGSVGGGYFPRVDVPTFTADNAAPGLPTASSTNDEEMTAPFQSPPLPQPPPPHQPQASSPQSFYQQPASPPPIPQPPQQPPPPQQSFVPQQGFTPSLPPPPPSQHFQYSPQPPQPQQYAQPNPAAPQVTHQGPFRTDEDSIIEAQKHAKWAISALNFEDVNTAVKELRVALRALGAN
jgi:vacuolar protein sorting-associated protein VTA1